MLQGESKKKDICRLEEQLQSCNGQIADLKRSLQEKESELEALKTSVIVFATCIMARILSYNQWTDLIMWPLNYIDWFFTVFQQQAGHSLHKE